MKDETLFDEIITTRLAPDGTLEASLKPDFAAAQEMEASVADMVKAWKDFKDANGDQYPIAVWTYNWWKALGYLALAEDHLKEQFLGRDRTPAPSNNIIAGGSACATADPIERTREGRAVSMRISKTKFCAGVQCLKRLYLLVHSPELGAQPDSADQAIIEQGREVGLLARTLFPGGIAVSSEGGLDKAIRATRELVANREVPAIFEGAFEHGGVLVRVDVLHRRRDKRWQLIEVKSTTEVKDHHLEDVAIQHRVVRCSGINLASSCLAHVNREYVYEGGPIDVHCLFKIRNLTRQVERLQSKLTVQLRSEFRVLAMSAAPNVPVGVHCNNPFTCEFFDHCNPPIPENHILRLPRIHASAVAKLVALGVQSIHDIPEDYPLTGRLRRACASVQKGKPWYGAEIKTELKGLKYPLCYMDFETANPCIPRFQGMRPYDQLPFQWSVHVQAQAGAEPAHYEFLATDSSDPRPAFVSALCDALGDRGSIVVYHQQFESQRLSDLASWLPEYSKRIEKIQHRLWDLLPIVRDHVYHPAFGGSYSLKSVLPALVPEMTYDGMEVADGQTAGLAWESLLQGGLDRGEYDKIRKALLDYCGQDTLGMVRLVEKFWHISE